MFLCVASAEPGVYFLKLIRRNSNAELSLNAESEPHPLSHGIEMAVHTTSLSSFTPKVAWPADSAPTRTRARAHTHTHTHTHTGSVCGERVRKTCRGVQVFLEQGRARGGRAATAEE